MTNLPVSTSEIFFLACEEKDVMSLLPVWQAVSQTRPDANFCTFGFTSDHSNSVLERIIAARFPLIVAASPASVDRILRSLRPRWSFWLIGVEHGISPFKEFTYSSAFLIYDDYFAPSRLWLDRLQKIYPSAKTRFHLGDYPKANSFSQIEKRYIDLEKNDQIKDSNVLVILSWGLREDAFFSLPDQENITYLLHPGQAEFQESIPFIRASVLWSKGELATKLVGEADVVFGDLSSLTFEVALARSTYLFMSNDLYIDNYDIDPNILDPQSALFGCVPGTDYSVDRQFILSLDELKRALCIGELKDKLPLSFEPVLMPHLQQSDRQMTVEGIINLAKISETLHEKLGAAPFEARLVRFVRASYRAILGREPDAHGLQEYIALAKSRDESAVVIGLEILLSLARSKEAQHPNLMGDVWPILSEGFHNLAPTDEDTPIAAERHKSLGKLGVASCTAWKLAYTRLVSTLGLRKRS